MLQLRLGICYEMHINRYKKRHFCTVIRVNICRPAMVAWFAKVSVFHSVKSRAASSVGVTHRSSGPITGSNPGGRRILKKGLKK